MMLEGKFLLRKRINNISYLQAQSVQLYYISDYQCMDIEWIIHVIHYFIHTESIIIIL